MSDEGGGGGAPAWMVSFGDMMTLILTFFILLVSMSKEQQIGLVAKGVGSFLVAVRSFGMPGIMDNSHEATVFEEVRRRFNLPPEDDEERRAEHFEASNLEQIKAAATQALKPHNEINQPAVAVFEEGSAELSRSAKRYLDLLAPTLRPGPGQTLQVEGHAPPGASRWLAFERARAVSDYLIENHSYDRKAVQFRAWLAEVETSGVATNSVDARLVFPDRSND